MSASWMSWALVAVVSGVGGLTVSNPGPDQFEEFAGRRLVDTLTREICGARDLPMGLGLVLQNCPELVASQHRVLGRIALQHTSRSNLGVASVYRTELGGQHLLATLHLPRYETVTLAGAGHFVVLSSSRERP